jgi:hypothetical protein
MAVESDTYRDYHIPKGAIIIPNIWCVVGLVRLVVFGQR